MGVEALGYLPVADLLPQTVDLDRLLALTSQAVPTLPAGGEGVGPMPLATRPRIAVARDAAFTFTYLQNLQALAEVGEVTYFWPMLRCRPAPPWCTCPAATPSCSQRN